MTRVIEPNLAVGSAQYSYDLDLARSMAKMATWIEPRSRKIADTLRMGAVRLEALSSIGNKVDEIARKMNEKDDAKARDAVGRIDFEDQPASKPVRRTKSRKRQPRTR